MSGPIPPLAGNAATSGLPVLPHTEAYHGIGGAFAPFAMMRLTDPSRLDAIISDDEEPRYTSTLDVQYIQTFEDTIQRFVEADIILSDGILARGNYRSENAVSGNLLCGICLARMGQCVKSH